MVRGLQDFTGRAKNHLSKQGLIFFNDEIILVDFVKRVPVNVKSGSPLTLENKTWTSSINPLETAISSECLICKMICPY